MKVYFNGCNLYNQFPHGGSLVETFIDQVYENATKIEVSYHFAVLLVAGTVVIQGAKNEIVPIEGTVSQISCSDDRVLVLLSNGDLLKVTDSIHKLPKLANLDDDDALKMVSSGAKLAVGLTKKGCLYSIPNKLDFKNNEIIGIKTGREHCLLLDSKGNVFSFGRGSRGQLGHGCLEDEEEPKFVEALGGIRIAAIAAGGWHSCALSTEGDIYVWGWNGNGQLGLSDVSVMGTPKVLDFDYNVQKISCGMRHTVVLTDKSVLYGCGWNKYKQLTCEDSEEFHKMVFLRDFSGEKVEDVKCGPWNTVVVVGK